MKHNPVKALIASAAVMLGFSSMSAVAATETDNLIVRLHIVDGCTVNFDRGRDIDLGRYANLSDAIQYLTSFSVRCTASDASTAGQSYSVGLDAGRWAATPNDTNTRRLRGVKGEYISYQVYQGNLPGPVWGNATDSDKITGSRAIAGNETVNRHDFLIQVHAQATPIVDDYADQLKATVTYAASN